VSSTPPAPKADVLSRVRLLATDVDGVLTDGTLYYGEGGESLKAFNVRDGLGLRMLDDAGISVAVISARSSPALARRMGDLGVRHVLVGRRDKAAALAELLAELSLTAADAAYIGDDLLDREVSLRVGLAIAVADADPTLRATAAWVTRAPGGRGAVREVADAILAARTGTRFRVVIPTRYAASRLPGKPLRDLAGRPMIAHVWDRAVESGAAEVLVATDDQRIAEVVDGFGGAARMTSADHPSGTDRIAEVAAAEGWDGTDVVVNLQGDEPLMDPALIGMVARSLAEQPGAGIATAAAPITDPAELFDENAVKVVVDGAGMAHLFSRAPVPWVRGAFAGGVPRALPAGVPFLRHIGLYAYRVDVLRRITAASPAAIEVAERLEQLRALDLGIGIHVTCVDRAPAAGVDTEEDLARAAQALAEGER